MHRIRYTKLTPEQIGSKLSAAANGPASASPLSEALAGTSLTIVSTAVRRWVTASPTVPASRLPKVPPPPATAALFAHPSEARLDPHVRSLAPAGFGEEDIIDIAPDRQTARGAFHCTVHLEAAIGPSCPLVEMARQQGGGVVRRSERGVFETVYVRCDGMWKIQRSTYRAV